MAMIALRCLFHGLARAGRHPTLHDRCAFGLGRLSGAAVRVHILRTVLLATACLLVSACASRHPEATREPAESDAVILWGPNWSFAISSVGEWIIDSDSGHAIGAEAIVRPRNLQHSDQGGYVAVFTVDRASNPDETLREFVERNVAASRKRFPQTNLVIGDSLTTADSRPALLVRGTSPGVFECSANIQAPTVFVRISLVAVKERHYREALPVFEHEVRSFVSLSSNVHIDQR